jgi:hypothetical protein
MRQKTPMVNLGSQRTLGLGPRLLFLLLILGGCNTSPFAGQSAWTGLPQPANAQTGAVTPFRDWTQFPAIAVRPMPADLWLLGDVHGDYRRLRDLLHGAGLANNPDAPGDVHWQAGTATLVCTGDLIDKGTDALDVIAYLQALSTQATQAGGEVIILLGNHEAEFLGDTTGSKVADFVAELASAGESAPEVAAGRQAPGAWLRQRPLAARVGSWFMCHAGQTHGLTLVELDNAIRTTLDQAGFEAAFFLADDSMLETKISSAGWWELSGQAPEEVLVSYAHALGAEHIVQGHQPQSIAFADGTKRASGTMAELYGRVFLIDVGMSSGVNDSNGALLHVRHDAVGEHATVVSPAGTAKLLWEGP